MRSVRRLLVCALCLGAGVLATGTPATVKADAFADAGCPAGNYLCLYGNRVPAPMSATAASAGYSARPASPFAAVGCADGDFQCYYQKAYGISPGLAGSVQSPYALYYPNTHDNDAARTQPGTPNPANEAGKHGQSSDDDR